MANDRFGQQGRRASRTGTLESPVSRRRVLGGLASAVALAGVSFAQAKAQPSSGWDFIVIGAGVFGAWTAWNLQRKGHKVLLLDAWGAAHSRASSGGETRLIRTEYAGDPLYTRWAWESLAEWHALSRRHESPIFHEIGALYLYPEDAAGDRPEHRGAAGIGHSHRKDRRAATWRSVGPRSTSTALRSG